MPESTRPNGNQDDAADLSSSEAGMPRRRVLQLLAGLGVGTGVFGKALATMSDGQPEVTDEMIRQAEWIAGVQFSDEERRLMLKGVNDAVGDYARLREVPLDNGVPPALSFFPTDSRGSNGPGEAGSVRVSESAAPVRPG